MKTFTNHKRSAFILSLIISIIFLWSQCIDPAREQEEEQALQENNDAALYAGSSTCANCHKDVYDDHIRTAHFLTSQPATAEYIKGDFQTGKNTYAFNRSVAVVMEKRADGYYQVEYSGNEEKTARKMDIVVGSGTMGQSSLAWYKDHLFQMPITYFTAADQWSNSPGFPNRVVFNRVITSRCLECHTTFAKTISAPGKEPEKFDRNSIIYGVDCEKCHGPAKGHVQFHTLNPQDSVAKQIVNPAHFSRQQKLDLCALCHGGRLQKTSPSFTFTAGDALADHFKLDTAAPDPNKIDVHGNQYGLLSASKCFIKSDMTCNTCHDPHKNERGKIALYSAKCMNCHDSKHEKFCPMAKTVGKNIVSNCIDCHMPLKPSRAIAVFLPGSSSPTAAEIRSHYITVPEGSQKSKVKSEK